jgi:hypothetical protein
MKQAANSFRYALRHIRLAVNLPLEPYKAPTYMTDADHAMKGLLDGAKTLGIDMGAEWGSELDLRNEDEMKEGKACT